jgi:hypothetical protein
MKKANALTEYTNEEGVELPPGIIYSEAAIRELELIPEEEQDEIVEGVWSAYRRITVFLVVASAQSFLSREQTFQLNYLTNTYQTVVAAGRPVRVKICSETYLWTVVSVGECGATEKFEVVKLI